MTSTEIRDNEIVTLAKQLHNIKYSSSWEACVERAMYAFIPVSELSKMCALGSIYKKDIIDYYVQKCV